MTKIRIYFLLTLFGALSTLLVFRAFQLQIMPSRQVERLAKRQLQKTISIVGRRGNLLDRNGEDLAMSVNSLSIYINPHRILNPKLVSRKLEWVLGYSEGRILRKIKKSSKRKFAWIKRQLNSEQLRRLEQLKLKKLKGVGIIPEFRRVYPYGKTAGHLLGFVSVDGKGLEGVEASQEKLLTGASKKIVVKRDAKGRPIFNHLEQLKLEDTKGTDLQLTIDVRFQERLETLVEEAVELHEADSASVIVMNPYSGEILGMAIGPNFDPNNPGAFSATKRRNRIITDPIEPGSVVKPFVVARALDEKLVSISTQIPAGDGKIKIGSKIITESDKKHYFKSVSIKNLIRYSSNVATVNLQKKIGFDKVADTFKRVGLMNKTGIDLRGESKGIFTYPTKNQLLERATISYGHGIATTPLQVLSAYAIFANGGYRVTPHVLKSESHPSISEARRIFSARTIEQMKEILGSVVESGGTGEKAQVEGYGVAGKTGTALKSRSDGRGYMNGAYVASFAGYFPLKSPEFVAYVVVDNPKKNGKYASSVAAPLFKKVAQAYLSVATKPNSRMASLATYSKMPKSNKKRSKYFGIKVPSLVGMNVVLALKELEGFPVNVKVTGNGRKIYKQSFKKAYKSVGRDLVELQVR